MLARVLLLVWETLKQEEMSVSAPTVRTPAAPKGLTISRDKGCSNPCLHGAVPHSQLPHFTNRTAQNIHGFSRFLPNPGPQTYVGSNGLVRTLDGFCANLVFRTMEIRFSGNVKSGLLGGLVECRARQPLAAPVGFGGASHQLPEPCPAQPSPPTLNPSPEFRFSQPAFRLSRDENCSTSTGASFCSRLYFRTAGDGQRAVAVGSRGGNKTTSPVWRLPMGWCTVGNSHHQHCTALHCTTPR